MKIEIEVPVRIRSEANIREHGARRGAYFKEQKEAVYYSMMKFRHQLHLIAGSEEPLMVTLTRFGDRRLDNDNLVSGFKSVRDSIASFIGIDDGSDRITWRYQQAHAKRFGARITIETVET